MKQTLFEISYIYARYTHLDTAEITNEHDFTIIIECSNVQVHNHTHERAHKQALTRLHRLKQNKFIDFLHSQILKLATVVFRFHR